MKLFEDRRQQLIARSRMSAKERGDGLNRFEKRRKSSISNSVKHYNRIDFNNLFKNDILTIDIEVHGETDDYIVSISFNGFLEELQDQLARLDAEEVDLRIIIRSLINAFNEDDVYIRCTCPDFKYRQAYWLSVDNVILGQKETRPSKITNPKNDQGPGCKHIMLVLSNQRWVVKVASVINNYVHYMQKHYEKMFAEIIYPAIYGKAYEGPAQTTMFDADELDNNTATVDQANEEGRTRGRFKKQEPTSDDNEAQ